MLQFLLVCFSYPLSFQETLYIELYIAFLTILWVRRVEGEHAEHEAHIKAEHGGELPPIPDYEYLNRRGKPFPWGMNSLFFNPHVSGDFIWDVQIHLY